MRALIAGAGIISAIGQGVGQTLTSLKSLDHGARFDQRYVSASNILSPVAEVKYSNEELAAMAGAPENWPRTALLGMIATREAVSGFPGLLEGTRSGLISAGTVGGMDRTEAFFREFRKNKQKGRLRDVVHHECGSVTELIAGGLGINTLVTTHQHSLFLIFQFHQPGFEADQPGVPGCRTCRGRRCINFLYLQGIQLSYDS